MQTDATRKDTVESLPLQFPFTEDNKRTHNKNGGIYKTSGVIESSMFPLINKMQYTPSRHSIPSLLYARSHNRHEMMSLDRTMFVCSYAPLGGWISYKFSVKKVLQIRW